MGLDNGFILVKEGQPINKGLQVAYFRKYYELDNFIRFYCEMTEPDSEIYRITPEAIKKLLSEVKLAIRPILSKADEDIKVIDRLTDGTSNDCSNNEVEDLNFYSLGNFSIFNSNSDFPLKKALRLYYFCSWYLEFVKAGDAIDTELYFYSSY